MTFVASTTPASKPETLHILASAAERSVSHPQHAESSEGHTGKSGPEQPARSMPGSAFGQHGQHLSPNSKADASRQAAAAKPDASAASAAAQQGLPAVKSVPAAGQSGMNVQGQPHAHSSSSSKSEAGKGAMAARTLMFFKGSPCALGCTVLLKGAPKHVLASVKKVTEVGGRLPPSAIRQCTHNLPHLRSSVTNAVIHLCTLVQGSPDVLASVWKGTCPVQGIQRLQTGYEYQMQFDACFKKDTFLAAVCGVCCLPKPLGDCLPGR